MGWNNQVVQLIILAEETGGFSGLFGYSPAPGPGNLVFSLSLAAGPRTDPFGNSYVPGLALYGPDGPVIEMRPDLQALLIYATS